jgi:hypothetical protein
VNSICRMRWIVVGVTNRRIIETVLRG